MCYFSPHNTLRSPHHIRYNDERLITAPSQRESNQQRKHFNISYTVHTLYRHIRCWKITHEQCWFWLSCQNNNIRTWQTCQHTDLLVAASERCTWLCQTTEQIKCTTHMQLHTMALVNHQMYSLHSHGNCWQKPPSYTSLLKSQNTSLSVQQGDEFKRFGNIEKQQRRQQMPHSISTSVCLYTEHGMYVTIWR